MKVRARALLPASALVCAVAVVPYATIWMPFQASLWVGGGALVLVIGALVAAGHRALRAAVVGIPAPVRAGLLLYAAAAAYGTALGFALGNPTGFVVKQAASMAILPLSFVGFLVGTGATLRRFAMGLGLGSAIALAIHAAFLVARAGGPAVRGEALRLVLPNDVAFTGTAVMAFLAALAWWSDSRTLLAAGACAASGALVVGSMSRGAWLVTLGGAAIFWWLSRRRRWWTLAFLAAVPVASAAALYVVSDWIWAHARVLARCRVEVGERPPGGELLELKPGVPATGRPIELAFRVGDPPSPPPTLVVKGRERSGALTSLATLLPDPRDPTGVVRSIEFPRPGMTQLDFQAWEIGGNAHVIWLDARELPGTGASWVRTLGLRLRGIGTALANPTRDGTVEYRLSEWSAVRRAWTGSSPIRRITGQGLGAVVEFPNSSWDSSGRRITLPLASYLHDFYVFLGFKLGLGGILALAGILLVAGWTGRAAWTARSSGGSPALAAAAACWCAYLAWDVTSPEILNPRTATLLGALLASSLADATNWSDAPGQEARRSQSSSISSE